MVTNMRDYILHQAQSRDSTFAFPKLRRWVRNWFAKRSVNALTKLNDYQLNDIGLTRGDLRRLMNLPYDVDPIEEMAMIRDLRAARGTRTR
jgi:uncharacterized protein YjiS (DUF1127 family)